MSMESEIIKEFKELDTSEFPDFYQYDKPLEMGLWILWIAKEMIGINKLMAEQISSIIVSAYEVSLKEKSLTYSLNRAGNKIHRHSKDGKVYYEIMRAGKDHLISQVKEGSINFYYFEPDKKFSSKQILAKNILTDLKDELKIVDPYCSERTLDIVKNVKKQKVKFLTRVDNLNTNKRRQFLRELQDFKHENPDFEFRSYPNQDIHDRYIISTSLLVILGHSIKDLGSKESFAIILDKNANLNIFEALTENFNRRWKRSQNI